VRRCAQPPRRARGVLRRGSGMGREHAILDFSPVEPTAILEGVVELDASRQLLGLLWGEGLVKRGRAVAVQIVEDDRMQQAFPLVVTIRPRVHLYTRSCMLTLVTKGGLIMTHRSLRLNWLAIMLILVTLLLTSACANSSKPTGIPTVTPAGRQMNTPTAAPTFTVPAVGPTFTPGLAPTPKP
jgi:hypothetical protein